MLKMMIMGMMMMVIVTVTLMLRLMMMVTVIVTMTKMLHQVVPAGSEKYRAVQLGVPSVLAQVPMMCG